MRLLRPVVWWVRYVLAFVLTLPVLLVGLGLGVLIRLGSFADGVFDALMGLAGALWPNPRGVACKACQGRGRVIPPEPENETPLEAARRQAGTTETPTTTGGEKP
jgi:hypothetical protein